MVNSANDMCSNPMLAQSSASPFNQAEAFPRCHAAVLPTAVLGANHSPRRLDHALCRLTGNSPTRHHGSCHRSLCCNHCHDSFAAQLCERSRAKCQVKRRFRKVLAVCSSRGKDVANRHRHGERSLFQVHRSFLLTRSEADNLEILRESVSPLADNNYRLNEEQQSWTIDVHLLGRLLLFETAGQRAHETDRSLRSITLKPKTSNVHDKTTLSAGYDLIGSTGISGHQSVPKDRPISAPLLSSTRSNHANTADIEFFDSLAPDMTDFEGALNYSGLPGSNGAEKGSNMLLPANEYGRSIDDWLGMDLA